MHEFAGPTGRPPCVLPRRQGLLAAAALLLVIGAAVTTAPAAMAAAPSSQADVAWSHFVDRDFSSAAIVTAHPDGRGLRQLTAPGTGVVDLDPVWSPDHAVIAFERDVDGVGQVVTVRADGTGERAVDIGCSAIPACDSVNDPSWTPDGNRLVFTVVIASYGEVTDVPPSAALWTARVDGSDLRRLSEPGIDGRYEDGRARYSADGSYLVFERGDGATDTVAVFRMNSDGSGVRQLTPWSLNADTADLSQATSGPTRDLVVFESYGHGGPPPGAVEDVMTVPTTCPTVDVCATQIRNLTRNGDGPVGSDNPTWSPDGSRIAFVEYVHPAPAHGLRYADIYTMSPVGTSRQQVSTTPTWDFRPDW